MPESLPAVRLARRLLVQTAATLLAAGPMATRGARAQGTPAPAAATPDTKSQPMIAPTTVTGTIVFPEGLAAGPPATIHVQVEDVSRADAPAVVIASVTLPNVVLPPPATEPVTVAIPVESYDPRLRYGVRVHVDRDGDGQVSIGDLVSTAHHPVLTQGGGTDVSIPVSEIPGETDTTTESPIPPLVWELAGFAAAGADPVEIAEPVRYTLQFLPSGRLHARLDCNQANGGFTAADGALTLTPMASTLKLCLPGSHDTDVARLLSQSASYRFDPDGFLLLRGEAGVLRLQPALSGVLWQWQGNVANDGAATLTPDTPANYTVTFLPEGRLAIQADCNRAMGSWSAEGSGIDLTIGGVTKRGCLPGSLMHPFLDALGSAISHGIHGGALALALPDGGGLMLFAPVYVDPERGTPPSG